MRYFSPLCQLRDLRRFELCFDVKKMRHKALKLVQKRVKTDFYLIIIYKNPQMNSEKEKKIIAIILSL